MLTCLLLRSGSRAQFNLLTATIDANTVYGVRESFARLVSLVIFHAFPLLGSFLNQF